MDGKEQNEYLVLEHVVSLLTAVQEGDRDLFTNVGFVLLSERYRQSSAVGRAIALIQDIHGMYEQPPHGAESENNPNA